MAQHRARIEVKGPFAGIVVMFIAIVALPYTAAVLTVPPVQYIYVGLSVAVTSVGLWAVGTGVVVFKSTSGFTQMHQLNPNEDVVKNMKQSVSDSQQLEEKK